VPHRADITPLYIWDPATGQYLDSTTGDPVPLEVVEAAMEAEVEESRERMRAIAEDLAEGNIDISEAQTRGMDEISIIAILLAALAIGGFPQVTEDITVTITRLTRLTFIDFEAFLDSVVNGDIRLRRLDGEINGSFLRLFDLFAQSGVGVFNELRRQEAITRGNTHEMRVLDPAAQHCNCCIGEAGHAEAIGTLRRIGNCTCVNSCRCRFVFGVLVDGRFVEENG